MKSSSGLAAANHKGFELFEKSVQPYERLTITPYETTFIMHLETNLMIHRYHTKKDLFTHHSFFSVVTIYFPDVPKSEVFRTLEKMRANSVRMIESGEYEDEVPTRGGYKSVKRHFNRYFYYDLQNREIVGNLKAVRSTQTSKAKEG